MSGSDEIVRLVAATRLSESEFRSSSLLGRMLGALPWPVESSIAFENRAGLPIVYNRALEAARDDEVLVFVHDDVCLTDFYWPTHLLMALDRFDLVGVAGCVDRIPRQPSWAFRSISDSGEPERVAEAHLSGFIAHGASFPVQVSAYGNPMKECRLLDGLLLAAQARTLRGSAISFDPRFAFHFYDMDFCRQAERVGLKMGTAPISALHASSGSFSAPAWRTAYRAYLDKWGE